MKVFVTGATGVLGRRVVPRLVGAGHQVTAIARTPEKAAGLVAVGAVPAAVDLFDVDGLAEAMAGHDAVVNLATHIPPFRDAAKPAAWAENDRIRTEGSAAVRAAAERAGVAVWVQESLAFAHADVGDTWLDGSAALDPGELAGPVRAAEAQVQAFRDAGGRGVVLRFGWFLSADSEHVGATLALARNGVASLPGEPDAWIPVVHVDDAATAVVAALEAPSGTYPVAAAPCTRRQLADALARLVGRPVRLAPAPVRRAVAARAGYLANSQRVRTDALGRATGWQPTHATGADVVATLALDGPQAPRSSLAQVAALAWLAVGGLLVGAWAVVAPGSFYADFPGLGRSWVAVDGPFNEHLVRDVGALQLALVVVTVAALWRGTAGAARIAGAAWLVFGGIHLAYHLGHLDVLGTGDQVAVAASLLASVVAAAVALVAPGRHVGVPAAPRADRAPAPAMA